MHIGRLADDRKYCKRGAKLTTGERVSLSNWENGLRNAEKLHGSI